MYLSISDSQVFRQINYDAVKLFEQGLMPFLNHEVGHLIQEAYDIVVQFLGWLGCRWNLKVHQKRNFILHHLMDDLNCLLMERSGGTNARSEDV